MSDFQEVKQRFGIIGHSPLLERAINTAMRVAPTDLSVLIIGESGTGKEAMPKIIHSYSARKHAKQIAVNCGAIPEGTIDSELFGHEKGSFTGATESRKGYFEVADGGTIFLDEVAELPIQTQARLLRVLETGEFIKVGSSKVQKTDVRIVAATNVNIPKAIRDGRFREDLYYRLNTVPINIPSLRERKEDILLLFRKFSSDFANKYKMPSLQLTEEAKGLLCSFRFPGNIRQLKNITEQISIIETHREITAKTLLQYLPSDSSQSLPILFNKEEQEKQSMSEREILYKVLFDMKQDMVDVKKLVLGLMQNNNDSDLDDFKEDNATIIKKMYHDVEPSQKEISLPKLESRKNNFDDQDFDGNDFQEHIEVEESLSIMDKEIELIKKALEKNHGKRKKAAIELGISERTLYRKIKEYNI